VSDLTFAGPSVYRTRCICDDYEAGVKVADIAARYGVSKQAVEATARRKGLPLRYAPKGHATHDRP
jgi:hypothetical protein